MYDPLACAAGSKHDDAILLLLEHGAGSSISKHALGTKHWRTNHLLLYIEAGGSNEVVIDMLTRYGSDMFKYGSAITQYDRRVLKNLLKPTLSIFIAPHTMYLSCINGHDLEYIIRNFLFRSLYIILIYDDLCIRVFS